MNIGPLLALAPVHGHPISYRRKLIRRSRHMEKAPATLAQHLARGRVHSIKISPEFAHHARGLEPREPVSRKGVGEGVGPPEFGERHTFTRLGT